MGNAQGTAWESRIVAHARDRGLKLRRAVQAGREDVGDIHGLPDMVLQAKDATAHKLAEWCDAATRQAYAAGVPWGAVVLKRRRGKNSSGATGAAYVLLSLDTLLDIMTDLAEGREALERLEELAEMPAEERYYGA